MCSITATAEPESTSINRWFRMWFSHTAETVSAKSACPPVRRGASSRTTSMGSVRASPATNRRAASQLGDLVAELLAECFSEPPELPVVGVLARCGVVDRAFALGEVGQQVGLADPAAPPDYCQLRL